MRTGVKGLAEKAIADIVATEDIHGIGFVHAHSVSAAEVNDYFHDIKILISKDCVKHLFAIETYAESTLREWFISDLEIGDNFFLDNFKIENLWLVGRPSMPASNIPWAWGNSVNSVRNMLNRLETMAKIDKSEFLRKFNAEVEYSEFLKQYDSEIKNHSKTIQNLLDAKKHVEKLASIHPNPVRLAPVVSEISSPGLNLPSATFSTTVKKWAEESVENKSSLDKAVRDLEAAIEKAKKPKKEILKKIEGPCQEIRDLSFGGRVCVGH